MLKIIIDNREINLLNKIKERDLDIYKDKINIENINLELGDIKIIFNDIEYIFERKTLTDLNNSIIDGRYKEQKNRLLSNYKHITYIIEGDDIIKSIMRSDKKISSVYINSIYRDKINIIFTKNIFETTTFLLTLCTKFIDNPDKYKNIEDKNIEYIDTIKIKSQKIKNITPDNCFILQLSQIPTISNKIATNIVNKYSSINILISSINNCNNNNEKIKLLSEIDKVGNEKAKKILEYMKLYSQN